MSRLPLLWLWEWPALNSGLIGLKKRLPVRNAAAGIGWGCLIWRAARVVACPCRSLGFLLSGRPTRVYIAANPGVVSASGGGYTTCLASSSAASVTGARWPVIAPAQMRRLVSFQKRGSVSKLTVKRLHATPQELSRNTKKNKKKTTAMIYQIITLSTLPRVITHASCRVTDQPRLIQDLTHRAMCCAVIYDSVFRWKAITNILHHHFPHSVSMSNAARRAGWGLTERTGFMNIHPPSHRPTVQASTEPIRRPCARSGRRDTSMFDQWRGHCRIENRGNTWSSALAFEQLV